MSDSELALAKAALRRRVRDRRAARGDDERARVAETLASVAGEQPRVRRATCVALYASFPSEPGTAVLRRELARRGTRVLLPVVSDDVTLDWVVDSAGAQEPVGERLGSSALAQAQVLLLPAQAVDTRGTRLGRGRGYYDRALAHAAPDAVVLGLVHDDELLDAALCPVPREPHDRPVHGVITPTRWIFFDRVSR